MSSTSMVSIRRRLSHALLAWSLAWGVAVITAVWIQADHEVDELLDETLQASYQVLAAVLVAQPGLPPMARTVLRPDGEAENHYAWQVVSREGRVLARSELAPTTSLQRTPSAGLTSVPGWRVFGRTLDSDGRMLYVAQTRDERVEAKAEVALNAVLAGLAVGLLGHLWLRARMRRELAPLNRLSERLAALEADLPAELGPAERLELQPVHEAIEAMAQRLSRRMARERAFSGHAAHSLRTPLAAIDAQLAVALREGPAPLRPRLQRVRNAAGRLQRVVAALLTLFRSNEEAQRRTLDVETLLSHVALDVAIEVAPGTAIEADPDLLTAALLNLLDNAQRVGARHVHIDVPSPNVLRLQDNGPGIPETQTATLREALVREDYDGPIGLGLMLADLVCRAHGGRLRLPDTDVGFAVELQL